MVPIEFCEKCLQEQEYNECLQWQEYFLENGYAENQDIFNNPKNPFWKVVK